MKTTLGVFSISVGSLLAGAACSASAPESHRASVDPVESTGSEHAALDTDRHGDSEDSGWLQWGRNSRHTSRTRVDGQRPARNLVDLDYDPLVPQMQASYLGNGDLLAHYQAPLVDGDRVFMMFKDADATFDEDDFSTQCWGENGFRWEKGQLVKVWSVMTDWKAPGNLWDFWEPVFHPALYGGHIYLPAAHGGVTKRDEADGSVDEAFDPFAGDAYTFTVSPLTIDEAGNVYYNTVKIQPPPAPPPATTPPTPYSIFYANDVVDSWLVRIRRDGGIEKVSYRALVPGAPKATDACTAGFYGQPAPWPPTPDAVAPTAPCGSIRVALNVAPAVAEDGTVYSAAVSHFASSSAFLVAATHDLTPKWAASLSNLFHDGCGVPASAGGQLPPNGQPGGCSVGAPYGVDPVTNQPGSGFLSDSSSASPVVAPDGSVIMGTWSDYNYAQGHLVHFSAAGKFLDAYPFGWDITPAVVRHGDGDDGWSIVLKDNHYGTSSYCFDPVACPSDRTATNPAYPEAYFVTQLDEHLKVEWHFQSTNTDSCTRNADGSVSCVSDHPRGFEWCVNAPVIDGDGVVYANSEDGNLYAIEQGGTLRGNIFQQLAIGAAYTPTSIGPDGKIYSQNDGHLFVVAK